MLIKDIVDLDEKAEFRSDVQLDAYDDPSRNLALLHSYLFSTPQPQRGLSAADNTSSTDLLGELVNAFLSPNAEARQVVIADYGHGKSHLALALANYFGRPAGSPEVKIVLQKLERALNDPAKASRFRDFKESKGQFLLIRLRGDIPESLPAQFLNGLERGLRENPRTEDVRPPFWHEQAENYLKNLSPEQKEKANAFLAQHDSELPLLLQEIRARHEVLELAVGAIRAATGIKPELREVSLARAIGWAVKTLVGQDKPFGGVLVLFDEFTLFLNKYARRHAAADLQDLLNGIDNHRGQAALVAFAQVDPETTADNLTLAGSDRADLKKVLGRLPRKHKLHSLLESVIDAYLRQSKRAWEAFNEPIKVRGPLSGASDIAFTCFAKRYERALRWSPTKFQETITKGCFPLHPITTVLLCNMRLETVDTGVPRTVLGFVMDQLQAKREEEAFLNGRPNWVLPTTLVDYFADRLAGDAYKSYLNARRTAGAEMSGAQENILKALLLYELGEVSVRPNDQFDFLCQASGLERRPAGDALRELVANSSIRQDGLSKAYSLWPVTADPQRLERALREKLKEVRFDERALADLNKALADRISGISFGLQPMEVGWGHSTDWGVREEVLTFEMFTAATLRERVQQTTIAPNGSIQDGARGYVFWIVARDDEERDYLRLNAERVLDEALPGDSPVPVVVVLPSSPQSALLDNFLRWRALSSLNNTERQDIGKEMLDHEEKRINGELVKGIVAVRGALERPFDIMRSSNSLVVPMAYRAPVKQLGETNLNRIVLQCYHLAYRWRPPEFDTRYQVASKGANNLRNAVGQIASAFFFNASKSLPNTYQSNRFVRDLYEKILQKKWGILAPDFRLQKPRDAGLLNAWKRFDTTFAPGQDSVKLGPILVELLNPPYGFDFNTAVILFAAWYGYNSTDLRVSQRGSLAFDAGKSFGEWLSKGAKDFVRQIHENAIAISRREPGDIEKELRQILADYTQKSYGPDEAKKLAADIQALAADERLSEGLRNQAKSASQELIAAAEAGLKYDQEAGEIEQLLVKGLTLSQLVPTKRKLNTLQPPRLVKSNSRSPQELDDALYVAAEQAARQAAALNSRLDDIGHYELHRQNLLNGRKIVTDAGYTDLTGIFIQALDDLETRREQLLAEESEKTLRVALETMRTDISLAALYDQRDYLTTLIAYSDSTIKLRDRKLAEAEAEIRRLEREAESLAAGVLNHPDQRSLKTAYDRLMLISTRYEGSPLEDKIAATKNVMDRYGRFLGIVADINRNARTLQDEESAKALLADLTRLENENKEWLGEPQRRMLTQARERITTQLETKRQEAVDWFSQMQSKIKVNSNPVRLLEELQQPPAFLSVYEEQQRQSFLKQVERRIDEDELARIEQQFRRIRDPELRQACIARLQAIMREGQRVGVAQGGH